MKETIVNKPTNYDNYGPYVDLAKNGKITIYTKNININNWRDHFNSIVNIMKDSIEMEFTQHMVITVIFTDGIDIDLFITDYLFNLLMWYMPIQVNDPIESKYLFFDKAITKNNIKSYIDNLVIDKHRTNVSNKLLNNMIDNTIYDFNITDKFSLYLANTINVEDTIEIMNNDQEFYNAIHADLSTTPIEKVKSTGMEYTNLVIDRIKNSKDILGYDHCLADCFRANEGINPKQFREFAINIGSKPDGQGGVFPACINSNFLTGGVNDPLSYFIDSSAGRTAQILAKMNVGYSGHFARLLGLNNMDTTLYPDPEYSCDTKNFISINVTDDKILQKLNNRYYRLHPNGIEKIIKYNKDKQLIGKTILIRSPMTCASYARGHGVCYKCYGDLAYTNKDINIGRIASEELSSKLTQILLSAKHLLETSVKELNWSEGFNEVFEIEANVLKLVEDVNFKGWKIIIIPDDIQLENEDDYKDDPDDDFELACNIYNEYITEFTLISPEGVKYSIHTENFDNLYISNELNTVIRKKAEAVDDKVVIYVQDLKDIPIFYMIIQNNELSKTLDRLKYLLNKKSVTKIYTKDQLIQEVLRAVIEGGLHVSSVHLEIILGNQIRSAEDILDLPEWWYPNEQYQVLTLNEALSCNPSITVTLSFQYLSKLLYNPLTYRKHKASFMDLFFIDSPQNYLDPERFVDEIKETDNDGKMIKPFVILKDNMYSVNVDMNDDAVDEVPENVEIEIEDEEDK